MWKTTREAIAILALAMLSLSGVARAEVAEEVVVKETVAEEVVIVVEDPVAVLEQVSRQRAIELSESERELRCMAEALYYEARGESIPGQLAVGQVVLNRVEHPAYPDTVCDVVYQRTKTRGGTVVCQFSWVCQRAARAPDPDNPLWQRMVKQAYMLINGHVNAPIEAAVNFHAVYVNPVWAKYKRREAVIGRHIFYR